MESFFKENPMNTMYNPNIADYYNTASPNSFSQTDFHNQDNRQPISVNSFGELNPVMDQFNLNL